MLNTIIQNIDRTSSSEEHVIQNIDHASSPEEHIWHQNRSRICEGDTFSVNERQFVKCANGGNCTAPDLCQCAEGWTGYDCRTPVCELIADILTRENLVTVDEEKVVAFELDPCGLELLHDPVSSGGVAYYRGNCTAPNQCTCTCFNDYNPHDCHSFDKNCRGPFQDPLVGYRDILPLGYLFGTRDCYSGYEGNIDEYDRYTTCHLIIFEPEWYERYSPEIISVSVVGGLAGMITYCCVRRRIKRKMLLAKIERRRSRRSSEESMKAKKGAFGHT